MTIIINLNKYSAKRAADKMRWQWCIAIGLIFLHWTVTIHSQSTDTTSVTAILNVTESRTTEVIATSQSSSNYPNDTSTSAIDATAISVGNVDPTAGRPTSKITLPDLFTFTTNGTLLKAFHPDFCRYGPIPEKEYKEACCRYHYRSYTDRWVAGSYYLVTILERMQRWKCRQFDIECVSPTWPFTEYTRHIYDLFCRRNKIEKACHNIVYETSERYQFQPFPNMTWKTLIETLDSSQMGFTDLHLPCVQVALFDRKDGGVGRFHEVTEPLAPFCGLQWNGYDYNTAVIRGVSVWTAMSLWCRSSVIICMVVIALAGIITTISNVLVLVVFGTTPRLRNSQAIYKMSLGAADLMVGVVVWPNMIVLQYLTLWTPRTMGSYIGRPYFRTTEKTPYSNPNLLYRYGGGVFADIFPTEYVRAMGFLTMLSLMVSVYTLMIASFDRFWAVFKPLRYNRFNAKKQAKLLSGGVWAISAVVCLLPIFTPGFIYRVVSSNLINVEGTEALVFVFVSLLLPLILTWVITVMTFQTSRRHARARQKIVSNANRSSESLERRLAKTLSIMVGAFTLSILPAVCCSVAGMASPVTSWHRPRNLNLNAATAFTTSEYLAIIVLTSNSMWNFLIYSFRTRGFRDVSSSVMKTCRKRSGLEYIRRGAMQMVSGARRVSLSTMINMRRFSTPETSSDSRKKSVTTLTGISKVTDSNLSSSGRPSLDSSTFANSSTDTDSSSKYTKSGGKFSKTTSRVEIKADGKKSLKKEDSEEYAGEDSTFGSFAINAGTDRLFESVMENVPEEIEPAPEQEKP